MKRELKSANEIRAITEDVRNKEIDIDKRVQENMERISKYIYNTAKRGESSTSVFVLGEKNHIKEITNIVLQKLHTKGYNAKASIDDWSSIKITW